MLQKQRFQATVLALMISALVGCGGGDDNSAATGDGNSNGNNTTPPSQVAMGSHFIFRNAYAPPGEPVTVDLGANLSTRPVIRNQKRVQAERERYRVQSVRLTDGGICAAPVVVDGNNKAITFVADGYGLCQLEVTLDRDGELTTRQLIVNYGAKSHDGFAQPLSLTLAPDSAETIDLQATDSLQPLLSAGYALHGPVLAFSEQELAARIIGTNALTITAGAQGGGGQVLFTLVRTDDITGEVLDSRAVMMNVAISSSGKNETRSQNLEVINPGYTTTVPNRSDNVAIDLRNGIVSGDKPEELQIIGLNAPQGGTLVLGNPIDGEPATEEAYFHNTAFTFTSDELGEFPVNYVVSDHHGGYVGGTVIINVGKLTSPNSPLANTPGRMVEWVQLTNKAGESVVVNRPVLYKEFEKACRDKGCEVPVDPELSDVEGEQWLATDPQTSADFCREYGMELISPAALKALLSQYTGDGKTLTTELGWPSREPAYHYLVRDMNGPAVPGNQSFDILSGTLSDHGRGISLCVVPPEEMTYNPMTGHVGSGMGTSTEDWLQMDPTGTLTIELANINGAHGTALDCKTLALDGLAATNVIGATCTPIRDADGDGIGTATLTLTPGSERGQALVSASALGDSFDQQSALNIFIDRSEGNTSGAPTLSNYKIEAQVRKTLGATGLQWVTVIDSVAGVNDDNRRLVRPGTPLRASWTHSDPDPFQQDATTVNWGNNVSVDSSDNTQATVGDQFGTLSITLTPGSKWEGGTVVETGTPVTLIIDVANNAPVVSGLDITPNDNIRGKTAFEETTTVINAITHTYSDPNNDGQDPSGTSYIWEHKLPWADNWISVKDGSNNSQTGESLDPAIIAQFFAKGSRYEGNDLRLRMTVKDDHGMKSADAVQMIYPVTDAPTTVVTIPADNMGPEVTLHRVGSYTEQFSLHNVGAYQALCNKHAESNPAIAGDNRLTVLKLATVNKLRQQKHPLRYWHPAFVSHPKMPFLSNASAVNSMTFWDDSTGTVMTQPLEGTTFEDASMVCQLVPYLTFHPRYERVMVGKTLQLDVHRENKTDGTWTKVPREEVTWRSRDTSIMTATPEGVLTGVKYGVSGLTAIYQGVEHDISIVVRSNREKIDRCDADTAPDKNNCLQVASNPDNSNQLFSSPATETLLGSLGFSRGDKGSHLRTYTINVVDTVSGLDTGRFADQSSNMSIDQRPQWCVVLNEVTFDGRTDWRLPTARELSKLQTVIASDTAWSKDRVYTSSDLDVEIDQYVGYQMVDGGRPTPHARNEEVYVSCVSDIPGEETSEDDASDTTTPSVENGDASSPDES